ncbi:hypothetical protein H0178_56895 [Cytobacillus firmus]|uniref:hypothetical protein n=1 Tax=Paenibacillus lautus TaxID=1401 RepID=UPI0038508AD3|nr:hypothetical protein [Cytobacillus firmus]
MVKGRFDQADNGWAHEGRLGRGDRYEDACGLIRQAAPLKAFDRLGVSQQAYLILQFHMVLL